MKRIILISLSLLITLLSCIGQSKKSSSGNDENSPRTNINVRKKFDKNGNVIGYDSTYTSVYSNFKGNRHVLDSIMNAFQDEFNDKSFFSNRPFSKNFIFDDSIPYNDFFINDHFIKQFKNEMARMDSMFREGFNKDEFFNKHIEPNVIK